MTDKEAFDLIAAHAVPGAQADDWWLRPAPKRDIVALLHGLERHGEDNIWRTARQAREEIERLRASLQEFVSITADPAGFTAQMLAKEGDALEQFIAEQEARVNAVIETARLLLGPNVGTNRRFTACGGLARMK